MRKSFQKKASSHDMMRETALKSNAEEGNVMRSQQMNNNVGENEGNCSWVPHERTGIYYPKSHEKVIDDVPPIDFEVNWFFQKLMGMVKIPIGTGTLGDFPHSGRVWG
ncbi:hypothetical protein WN943_022848 [Citrus x changshan-huyou]